jgi:hypothetical protein
MADLPSKGVIPPAISPDEFMKRLDAGETHVSPVGKITFDRELERHWVHAGKVDNDMENRAKNLPAAIQTVKTPEEIWERGDRLMFTSKFDRPGEKTPAVVQVFTDLDGTVKTYFVNTKQINRTDKSRSGKLRL